MTNFSFEETNTGITWIDGREIYQRSFRWNNPGTISQGANNTGILLDDFFDIIDFTTLIKNIDCYESVNNLRSYIDENKYLGTYWVRAEGGWVANSAIITIWYCKK